jgi:flagellar motor switch protein FliM
MESPGKIGMLVGERIAKLVLDSLVVACSEYGAFSCEIIKSIAMPNLTSKMSMDDRVYSFDMAIAMSEIEMKMCIIIPESFIREFIPIKGKEVKHVESNFWRSAIETQVSDSTIDINVTLNDVKFKINDLLAMKTGDLIPIGDPTLTYVCLNKLKLFRASAGQANSKRVVKIVSEV